MRISDWSSDVCSSDLFAQIRQPRIGAGPNEHPLDRRAGDPDAALQPHIGKSLFHRGPPRGVAFMARIGNGLVDGHDLLGIGAPARSEEHTSELQSLMRISYAVFCLKKKKQ